MGSPNASILGANSAPMGSIGRGGTSNQTTGSLQVSRSQQQVSMGLQNRRRRPNRLSQLALDRPFQMPETLLDQARTIPLQTYEMRMQNG